MEGIEKIKQIKDSLLKEKDNFRNNEYIEKLENLLSDAINIYQELSAQNNLSSDMLHNTLSGIYLYHLEDINDDSTLRMVYANPISEKLTGVKCIDIIGKTLDENFPRLREKGIPQAYAEVVRKGRPIEMEDLYYSDNRVIAGAFMVKAFPLKNNHVGVSFENITKLKQYQDVLEKNSIQLKEQNEEFESINEELKESYDRISEFNEILKQNEAYLNSIFKSAPVGIGVVKNRYFTFLNDLFCNMLGYQKDELIGKSARILYHTDEEYEYVGKEKYRQISESGTGTVETVFRTKEGKSINVILSSTPIDINDLERGVTFTALDITEKNKAVINLNRVFTLSADMICIASLDGYFTNTNPAFKTILGYDEHELISKPFFDFIHPDDVQNTIDIVNEKLKKNVTVINFENRYRCKNGIYKWLSWVSQPISSEGLTFAIARDITEAKKRETELQIYSDKLEEAQKIGKIGHYSFDIGKGTWTCSKTLDDMFEIDDSYNRDVDGWGKIMHPEDKDEMLSYLINHVIGKKQIFNKQYRIVGLKTGHVKWVHGLGNLEIDKKGNPLTMFGTIQDISERKEFEFKLIENEKALKEKNEEYQALNEELKEANDFMHSINKKLIKATEKAEESDRLKTAFLTNMSHEIRTPMNGIIGFANLLNEEGLSKDKKEHYLQIIDNSAKQLLTIISDIIDISKIEADQIDIVIKPFKINNILNEIEEFIKSEKKNRFNKSIDIIKVIHDDNPTFHNDEIRLKQIFINLLNNSLKFTNDGTIKFGYEYINDSPVFFVTDTGCGISPENLDIIFERFRQEEYSNTRTFGGTGLGLTICKGLTQNMGGKIWVESEKGKGTTFYFTIDTKGSIENENAGSFIKKASDLTINEYNWQGKTILIVEDMEVTRMLLEEILRPTGVKTIFTAFGRKAVELYKKNSPDIILMDIQLPDINGYEATKEIRKLSASVPIIAQTAFAMSGDDKKALDAGCNDYISKPYNKSAILSLLQKNMAKQNKHKPSP